MENILFRNTNYKIREIEIPNYGNVIISTVSLNKALMNEKGGYISDEASTIDENIFYFLEENELNLEDNDLINLLSL